MLSQQYGSTAVLNQIMQSVVFHEKMESAGRSHPNSPLDINAEVINYYPMRKLLIKFNKKQCVLCSCVSSIH